MFASATRRNALNQADGRHCRVQTHSLVETTKVNEYLFSFQEQPTRRSRGTQTGVDYRSEPHLAHDRVAPHATIRTSASPAGANDLDICSPIYTPTHTWQVCLNTPFREKVRTPKWDLFVCSRQGCAKIAFIDASSSTTHDSVTQLSFDALFYRSGDMCCCCKTSMILPFENRAGCARAHTHT